MPFQDCCVMFKKVDENVKTTQNLKSGFQDGDPYPMVEIKGLNG